MPDSPTEEWDTSSDSGAVDPAPESAEPKVQYGDERDMLPEFAVQPEGPFGKPKKVRLADKTYSEKRGHADETNAARLAALERSAEIWQLRLDGWTLRQLAEKYGVGAGTISKILSREVERVRRKVVKNVEHMKWLMDERLEFMWKALHPQMAKGNFTAAAMGLKIMERQAKLHGLDEPEKSQVDVNVNYTDAELVRQAALFGIPIPPELKALAAGASEAIEDKPLDPAITDAEFEVRHEPAEAPESPPSPEEGQGLEQDGPSLPGSGGPV